MKTQASLNARQRRTIQIYAAAVGALVIAAMCVFGNDSRPIRYFVLFLGLLAVVMALILVVKSSSNRQSIRVILGTAGIATGCAAALLQGGYHPILTNLLWVFTAVLLLITAVFRRGTQTSK